MPSDPSTSSAPSALVAAAPSQSLTASSLASEHSANLDKLELAAVSLRKVHASLRRHDADDPEQMTEACLAILVRWPDEVIERFADPVDGILTMKFRGRHGEEYRLPGLPTPGEVKTACERLYEPIAREIVRLEHLARRAAEPPRIPRTPEQQAIVDRHIAERLGNRLPPPPEPVGAAGARPPAGHGARIAADLAARAERRKSA